MLLQTQNLSKNFGTVKALDQVSFQLETGKTYSIVGESGSGKTTLARLITGLERPDFGSIHLNGKLIASGSFHLSAEKRAVGLVFQDYALFPHLTVEKNIEYGIAKTKDKKRIVESLLTLVNLEGYGSRYPHELSGGQQQRVALARALAPEPQLLILDEPFSNLDTSLRNYLRTELFNILQQTGVSSIFVTHDTKDALAVSDEILILRNGQLLQQATPEKLYQQPATPYIAQLFDFLVALSPQLVQKFGYSCQPNRKYYLRSRDFKINQDTDYQIATQVKRSVFMGTYYTTYLQIEEEEIMIEHQEELKQTTMNLGWQEADLLIFD
ncbi:MAG: ABC transporter ATP-binding protein [Bacteroidota bacterium]